jgi:hypothetical protein
LEEPEPTPGSFNDDHIIRGIVTDAIRKCPKTRDAICEEMSDLLGQRVTVRSLNSYTSEAAEEHRWPAQYTRAFCHATCDWRLLRCITERAGLHLITNAERKLLELGKQTLIIERAQAAVLKLKADLQKVSL